MAVSPQSTACMLVFIACMAVRLRWSCSRFILRGVAAGFPTAVLAQIQTAPQTAATSSVVTNGLVPPAALSGGSQPLLIAGAVAVAAAAFVLSKKRR